MSWSIYSYHTDNATCPNLTIIIPYRQRGILRGEGGTAHDLGFAWLHAHQIGCAVLDRVQVSMLSSVGLQETLVRE